MSSSRFGAFNGGGGSSGGVKVTDWDYLVLGGGTGSYILYDHTGTVVGSPGAEVSDIINPVLINGNDVLLGPGVFNVGSGALTTKFVKMQASNCQLRGLGKEVTTLLWNSSGGSGGASGNQVVMPGGGGAVDQLTVRDLTIDGNNLVDCMRPQSSLTNLHVENVRMQNGTYTGVYNSIAGAAFGSTYGWFFHHIDFHNNGLTGIILDTDVSISIGRVYMDYLYFDKTSNDSISVGGVGAYDIFIGDNITDLSTHGFGWGSDTPYNVRPPLTNAALGQVFNNGTYSGVLSNPWGATNTDPFVTGNATIVIGGSSAAPNSGTTYTVLNPMDMTVGAGTTQTITTKDALGNTIDNAVATLSHRLLLPGYKITITAVALGTVTAVNAIVGYPGSSAGSFAAAPSTGVKYVVCNVRSVSFAGGSGLTTTTLDGTSNTGGNTIDSAITGNPTHPLYPGQIISYSAVSTGPTVIGGN